MAVRNCGLFVAFALSLGSLICILLLLFGGLDKPSKAFDNLFFLQLDLTTFFANEPEGSSRGLIPSVTGLSSGSVPGMTNDNQVIAEALWHARRVGDLKQFYSVYLWNWCSSDASDVNSNAFCSASSADFEFNPLTALNLTQWVASNSSEKVFPTVLQDALNTYDRTSRWLRSAYIIAGLTKLVELVIGLLAICSKWGSLLAVFAALFSSAIIVAASVSETAVFGILVAAWNDATGSIGVHAHLGKGAMALAWLAVALSFGASFWWLLTICCSNQRSGPGRSGRRGTWVPNTRGFTGYKYENVDTPQTLPEGAPLSAPITDTEMGERVSRNSFLQASGHKRSLSATGYEGYRHQDIGA